MVATPSFTGVPWIQWLVTSPNLELSKQKPINFSMISTPSLFLQSTCYHFYLPTAILPKTFRVTFSIEAGDLEAGPLVTAQARVLEAPVGQFGLPAT